MKAATVTGHVSGPGVSDFSGCVILLYNAAGHVLGPASQPPVNAAGRYTITPVPPGRWQAVCVPDPATPLIAMTYRQAPGLRASQGTPVDVRQGQTVMADFQLSAAGRLQVTATDAGGHPVAGATVLSYLAATTTAAGLPVLTDPTGAAHLYNVPLQGKIAVQGPPGFGIGWWGGGQSWKSARTVRIPAQGAPLSLTVVLPRA